MSCQVSEEVVTISDRVAQRVGTSCDIVSDQAAPCHVSGEVVMLSPIGQYHVLEDAAMLSLIRQYHVSEQITKL